MKTCFVLVTVLFAALKPKPKLIKRSYIALESGVDLLDGELIGCRVVIELTKGHLLQTAHIQTQTFELQNRLQKQLI